MAFVISILYYILSKIFMGKFGGSMGELKTIHRSRVRKKRKRKKRLLFIVFLIIIFYFFISYIGNKNINSNLYNFMKVKSSREEVYSKAIKLNNGSSANTCVYFIAEALRMNGEKISSSICNTSQLLNAMEKDGWKKEKDYKKLKPGDICFTTDEKLNKNGIPSHTYIFMGWQSEGNYEYAYICDNQAKDYKGEIYHLRNITIAKNIGGSQKDPFSFFLYR
jgi:hypothetical protein